MAVQIFAPIGACWAATIAASWIRSPAPSFATAMVRLVQGQTDQAGHRAHDGCCLVCSVLQTGAPVDVPQIAAIAVERGRAGGLVRFARLTNARAGSRAGARPPAIS